MAGTIGGGAGVSFANGVSMYWALDENGNKNLKVKEYPGMRVYGPDILPSKSKRE